MQAATFGIVQSSLHLDIKDCGETPAVFSDVLLPGEERLVRDAGGVLVMVDRPGFEPEPSDHVTVTSVGLLRPDVLLVNDGTPDQLRVKVDRLVERLSRCRR